MYDEEIFDLASSIQIERTSWNVTFFLQLNGHSIDLSLHLILRYLSSYGESIYLLDILYPPNNFCWLQRFARVFRINM